MTDQGGWYSIKTLDPYFRILYFNQQIALYEVCFVMLVLNRECQKLQIMNFFLSPKCYILSEDIQQSC